jgi:hypothetical protein
MSESIGPLHYSEARAVKVREPEDLNTVHSAIHGEIAVYTDSRLEADAVLAGWPDIMAAASAKAEEILAAVPVTNGNGAV